MKNMSTEDLQKRLKEIKHDQFMLEMCDRWSREDYDLSHQYHKEIMAIEAELKERGE